ncbi:MAG TPA: LacI family DNA-binding transcriptional regulator [Anaerolineales bacterium]|nr:LacI family DNA-binding transcriptional regulator [Anaerolineales bacterium]
MKTLPPHPTVKMADIAQAAGVSLATVGRVLHKSGYVSPENREKIERLIQDLGYVPNKMAQGLKNRQSKLIGHLMVFNPNMLFAKISLAVNQAALAQGFHVLSMTGHRDLQEEEAQVNELLGHQVDGVIITSNGHIPRALIQKLVELNIPVVMVERTYDLPQVDRIRVDDLSGAEEAVQHLIAHGHQRIGFIGMENFHEVEELRYQGYCQALARAGVESVAQYICLMPEYSVEAGAQAMETLLKLAEPPTAVFTTSDLFACGVLQALYQHGKRVPEDLSLVGYDDTLSTLLAPPVTSVGLSLEEIGENAIALLLQRMTAMDSPANVVTIKTVLIERQSVRSIS